MQQSLTVLYVRIDFDIIKRSQLGRILSVDFLRSLRLVRMRKTPGRISFATPELVALGTAAVDNKNGTGPQSIRTHCSAMLVLQSGLMNPTCPEITEANQ